MRSYFSEIAVIANVVANPIFIDVAIRHPFASEAFRDGKSLQDGTAIRFATTQVINFGNTRRIDKGFHESRDIERVNIVPDLLTFVAKDTILVSLKIALDQVAQETVQLNSCMIRSRQTASSQTACWHPKVAAVLLDRNIG